MKKVTMQLIADKVGVSKFAVSQALSGKQGVGEETRAKIIQTATALGYYSQPHIRTRPRSPAQSDSDAKLGIAKNTVIILIPNVRFQHRDSVFWGRIIDGVSLELEKQGIGVMMVTESNSEGFMKIINPSGVLGLIGIGFISNQLLLEIRSAQIPFVLIDHEDSLILSDTVFMNNYDCMRKLTAQLIYMGHREMRFVGSPAYSRSFHDRWWGFRSTLEEHQLQAPNPATDPFMTQEEQAHLFIDEGVRQLVAMKSLPSVFVCANDFYAYHLLYALGQNGIKVPEDVSVTGFDETLEREKEYPGLCTVHVSNELMGMRAVEVLLKRLKDPELPYEKTLIYGDVVIRNTVSSRRS